ncbi:MAG: OmpH family outer membrane protein [Flavobacteriales bacterium]|nr:OmpH family outer membrane protein [Flavobacteriales bacterium]
MKNLVIIGLLAFIGISANVPNETKIGYVYMDMVMNNMPEAKEMMTIIDRFTAEKQAEIEKKKADIAKKLEAFQKKSDSGELSDAGKIIAQNEVKTMKADMDAMISNTEQEIYAKRSELLSPVAKKLEKAMDEVAAKLGYRYVLSSADGTGNSIVIVGPDEDNLTPEVMKHLGIEMK